MKILKLSATDTRWFQLSMKICSWYSRTLHTAQEWVESNIQK